MEKQPLALCRWSQSQTNCQLMVEPIKDGSALNSR